MDIMRASCRRRAGPRPTDGAGRRSLMTWRLPPVPRGKVLGATVTRRLLMALALLLVLAVSGLVLAVSGITAPWKSKSADVPARSANATSTSAASSGTSIYSCVTSDYRGRCGPYDYRLITGATQWGTPSVDQNVWSPIQGQTQTLYANSPGDWKVASKVPAGNTSVTTYPNAGAGYNEQPLSDFSSVTSTFDETMPHTDGTSAWAMYDLWFNNWGFEVMIQHDFVGNGPCDYDAVATFGGSNGVPQRLWGLCSWGNVFAWKLAAPGSTAGGTQTMNMSSGTIDIKAMVEWLVSHGYMAADPTITNLSYGWEICSTNGVEQTFAVSSYSLAATPVGS